MSYKVDIYLRDTRNGVTEIEHDDYEYTEENPFCIFMWEEGNYSCDCNRSIFLYKGDKNKKLWCNRCDNIIIVDKIIRTDTGEILYTECGINE